MANRKGVVTKSKWQTSDGIEHESVNEANDHQGALNEMERSFEPFMNKLQEKIADIPPVDLPAILQQTPDDLRHQLEELFFDWEKEKCRINRETGEGGQQSLTMEPGASEAGSEDEGPEADLVDPE